MHFPKRMQYGVMAKEVEAAAPSLVLNSVLPPNLDSLGNVLTPPVPVKMVNYIGLIPVLIEGFKEQQSIIDSQNTRITNLENIVNNCCGSIQGGTGHRSSQQGGIGNSSSQQDNTVQRIPVELSNKKMIKLLENDPNPFSEKTTIKFYIPDDVKKAQMYFYDNAGNILRIVDIKEKGEGTIEVFASNLSSGIYTYTLVADGKQIDTKRMLKTE